METSAQGIEVGSVLAFVEHAPADAIPYLASAASLEEYAQVVQVEWFGCVAQPLSTSSAPLSSSSSSAATVVSTNSKSHALNCNLWFAFDSVYKVT